MREGEGGREGGREGGNESVRVKKREGGCLWGEFLFLVTFLNLAFM